MMSKDIFISFFKKFIISFIYFICFNILKSILIEAIKKINMLDEYCHGILQELKINLMLKKNIYLFILNDPQ